MSTHNEPLAHVHHRIAESVSRDTGVDVDASVVAKVLENHPPPVMVPADGRTILKPEIHSAIINEAREYGVL